MNWRTRGAGLRGLQQSVYTNCTNVSVIPQLYSRYNQTEVPILVRPNLFKPRVEQTLRNKRELDNEAKLRLVPSFQNDRFERRTEEKEHEDETEEEIEEEIEEEEREEEIEEEIDEESENEIEEDAVKEVTEEINQELPKKRTIPLPRETNIHWNTAASLLNGLKKSIQKEQVPMPIASGVKATSSTCPIKIAQMAFSRGGTLLYTDDERTYWSTRSEHAEEVFIRETKYQDISNIKEIRIKNSPCSWCANELIEHFALQPNKPTMYIGKIWTGDYGNRWTNREGLRRMKRNGFHLTAWYADKIIWRSASTENYLKNL